MSQSWSTHPLFVCSGPTCIFLGAADASSPPDSPTGRRPKHLAPGSRKQPPLLAVAAAPLAHRQAAASTTLLYFEVFVKTTGGGLSPTGSVGVGLAAPLLEGSDADAPRFFLHYHSGSGSRHDAFPRPPSGGSRCGPSFGVGDTVGCGWTASGAVFFTFNGRHLGVASNGVWGSLFPAVEVDTPGACVELSFGREGERKLRYQGDGRAPDMVIGAAQLVLQRASSWGRRHNREAAAPPHGPPPGPPPLAAKRSFSVHVPAATEAAPSPPPASTSAAAAAAAASAAVDEASGVATAGEASGRAAAPTPPRPSSSLSLASFADERGSPLPPPPPPVQEVDFEVNQQLILLLDEFLRESALSTAAKLAGRLRPVEAAPLGSAADAAAAAAKARRRASFVEHELQGLAQLGELGKKCDRIRRMLKGCIEMWLETGTLDGNAPPPAAAPSAAVDVSPSPPPHGDAPAAARAASAPSEPYEEVELAQLAGTSPQTPARAAAAAEDSAEVSSEPLMRSAAPDSAAPAAVDDLDNVALRRNLSPQPLPPPGAVPLPPPLTGGGGGSGDGRPSLESHPSDVPTPVHVREAEPQYLAAAMRRADSAREAEEPHAASDANKLQRLLTLYDEFRRCTSIDKARLKLNALLQQRASAKPDSAEAREAVQEVVILAASPEPLVQLGAAALLARLTDHAEGARHALKCGGLGPLMNLWEQQHAAAVADADAGRGGGSDHASELAADHRRAAALYAIASVGAVGAPRAVVGGAGVAAPRGRVAASVGVGRARRAL